MLLAPPVLVNPVGISPADPMSAVGAVIAPVFMDLVVQPLAAAAFTPPANFATLPVPTAATLQATQTELSGLLQTVTQTVRDWYCSLWVISPVAALTQLLETANFSFSHFCQERRALHSECSSSGGCSDCRATATAAGSPNGDSPMINSKMVICPCTAHPAPRTHFSMLPPSGLFA